MANGLERREFLKVIGATGAGAALTACGTGGAERLIPYVVAPEEIVPGMATWYRPTCRECPAGRGPNVQAPGGLRHEREDARGACDQGGGQPPLADRARSPLCARSGVPARPLQSGPRAAGARAHG